MRLMRLMRLEAAEDVSRGHERIARSDFELVGGRAAVDRIVETFYGRMDALPEAAGIRALHPADLSRSRDLLRRYLGEWLGGPALYSAEKGHPRLRARHLTFRIGPAERDAWMLCMRAALDEVVVSPPLRERLLHSLFRIADWMRNDAEAARGGHG